MNVIFQAQRSTHLSSSAQVAKNGVSQTPTTPVIEQNVGSEQNQGGGGDAGRLNLSAGAKWASIVARKALTSKGASLTYIPQLVKDDKQIAQLSQSEVDALAEIWSTTAILYVVEVNTIYRSYY